MHEHQHHEQGADGQEQSQEDEFPPPLAIRAECSDDGLLAGGDEVVEARGHGPGWPGIGVVGTFVLEWGEQAVSLGLGCGEALTGGLPSVAQGQAGAAISEQLALAPAVEEEFTAFATPGLPGGHRPGPLPVGVCDQGWG